MEHSRSRNILKILPIFFVALFAVSGLTGCKSENPNPELLDPIYLDLKKGRDLIEKELEAQKKTLEEQKEKLSKVEARTKERVIVQRSIQKAQDAVELLSQEFEYIKIREERRRVEARRDYKVAFQAGKDWPDKKEFELYQKMKALRHVSKSWDARVPKLSDRIPKPSAAAKKTDKPAEAPAAE